MKRLLIVPAVAVSALLCLCLETRAAVRIHEPEDADLLSGRTMLRATVEVPQGRRLAVVSFRVDGRALGEDREAPFEVVWEAIDTQRDHLIRATALFDDGSRAYDLLSIPVLGMVTRATVLGDAPDRVLLGVTFLDRDGQPLADVTRDEVRVFEDGRKQIVEVFSQDDRPLSVQLLLDASDSTRQHWTDLARSTRLFAETLRPDDRAGVEAFSHMSFELAPLGSPPQAIENATSRFQDWGGGTMLYDVLSRAALVTLGREPSGRKALLVLTDGEDFGSMLGWDAASDYLTHADIQVHSVVWYPDNRTLSGTIKKYSTVQRAHRLLERLVLATGGEQLDFSDKHLEETFLRIGEKLRTQYLVGYTSLSKREPGKLRSIEVRLRRPGSQTVRYRRAHYGGESLHEHLARQIEQGSEESRLVAIAAAGWNHEPEVVQALIHTVLDGKDLLAGLAGEARLALIHLGPAAIPDLVEGLSSSSPDSGQRMAQVLADLFVVMDRAGHLEDMEEGLLLLGHGDRGAGRRSLEELLSQELIPETRTGLEKLLASLEADAG